MSMTLFVILMMNYNKEFKNGILCRMCKKGQNLRVCGKITEKTELLEKNREKHHFLRKETLLCAKTAQNRNFL